MVLNMNDLHLHLKPRVHSLKNKMFGTLSGIIENTSLKTSQNAQWNLCNNKATSEN